MKTETKQRLKIKGMQIIANVTKTQEVKVGDYFIDNNGRRFDVIELRNTKTKIEVTYDGGNSWVAKMLKSPKTIARQ